MRRGSRRVDAINSLRYARRSRHVISRAFASLKVKFSQVSPIYAPSSIPGSSTRRAAEMRPFFMAIEGSVKPRLPSRD